MVGPGVMVLKMERSELIWGFYGRKLSRLAESLRHRGWNSWTGDGVDYEVSGVRCWRSYKEAQPKDSVEKKEEKLSTG